MKITPKKNFSKLLLEGLKAKHCSQKQLAQILKRDPSTISLWLIGKQVPRIDDEITIKGIAKFLDTTPKEVKDVIVREKYESHDVTLAAKSLIKVQNKRELRESFPEYYEALRKRIVHCVSQRGTISIMGENEALRAEGANIDEKTIRKIIKELTESIRDPLINTSQDDHLSTMDLPRFQQTYKGVPWIRDAIRRVCRDLDGHFSENIIEEILTTDLLEIIRNTLTQSIPKKSKQSLELAKISESILDMMIKIRFFVENSDNEGNKTVSQHYEFSSEFLINRLFGISFSISNFDFLFDGGLLMPIGTGQTLLIKGSAGTGKTTLALQIAASMASNGNLSVYLSAEEELSFLLERLSFIGCFRKGGTRSDKEPLTIQNNDSEFNLLCSNFIDDQIVSSIDHLTSSGNKKGVMLLISIPNRNDFFEKNNKLLSNLSGLLDRFNSQSVYSCFIIDSLDALANKRERKTFEKIFNFAKKNRNLSVFLSESYDESKLPVEPTNRPHLIQDFLVDTVIHLDYLTRIGFKERIIEIEKCRCQNHIRGRHMFSIQSQEGVTIYPSVQALLSVWRKRKRPDQILESERWALDEHFQSLCYGDIMRASANLLKGGPSTFKLLLGLSFLASEFWIKDREISPVLLVSLREDEAALMRVVRSHPQLKPLCIEENDSYRFNPLFNVVYSPPDYHTAERFIHKLRIILRKIREKYDKRVSRVLFSNIDQLFISSPLFSEERLFLGGIIELFKKEGVTSLFISVGKTEIAQIENMFETIIYTSIPTQIDSQAQKAVEIEIRSGAFNEDREVKRLSRSDKGKLELTSL